jgi:hypothetical protein
MLRVERMSAADGEFTAGSVFTQPVRSADKKKPCNEVFLTLFAFKNARTIAVETLSLNSLFSLSTHSLIY